MLLKRISAYFKHTLSTQGRHEACVLFVILNALLVTWENKQFTAYTSFPKSSQFSSVFSKNLPFKQINLPPQSKASLLEVIRTEQYTEGVVVDYEDNIYFSHGEEIIIIEPDGSSRVWAKPGDPNGHKVLADGTHLVANDSRGEILRLDANGNVLEVVANAYKGRPLRAPNDLTLDLKEGFYFTDPGDSSIKNPKSKLTTSQMECV